MLRLSDGHEQLHRQARTDEADHAVRAHGLTTLQHNDDAVRAPEGVCRGA
jgi:hypothetical protein